MSAVDLAIHGARGGERRREEEGRERKGREKRKNIGIRILFSTERNLEKGNLATTVM